MGKVFLAAVAFASTVLAQEDEQLSLLQKRARVHVHTQGNEAACRNPNRLIFGGTSVIRNNLGGAGAEGLEYENVFPHSGEQVNLVINAVSGYEKDPNRNNGVNNKVAKINLKTGKVAKLQFTFSKTVGPFYLSFLDFDEMQREGKAREKVTITTFDSYELTATTIVATTTNADGTVTFSSTTHGTGDDNVADTHTMTQEQLDKSVSVLMPAVNSFEITLEAVSPPKNNNRFFQFAGITNGVCDTSPTPETCGNACNLGMAYKKCAFWGDPHYQKTFNAQPPNYNNFFDIHAFGVVTLAKTKCNSVEIQAVQCPWHGGGAAISSGFAVRVGSKVATIIGRTIRNPDGLNIQGSGTYTFTSPDQCATAWFRCNGGVGTPGRSYYMDMEIKIDDPHDDGNCNGQRRNYMTAAADMLFTSAELQPICGHCRFACPGALLAQDPQNADMNLPTAAEVCQEAGVSYADADAACQRLSEATENGGDEFHHNSCIMDYCGSGGDQEIIDNEIAVEKQFEDEDRADENKS